MSFMEFLGYYQGIILKELLRHLEIVIISIPAALIISIPLGFFISSRPQLAKFIIYITSILMTIPSLALFGFMVILLAPFNLGLGMVPAIIAIALYSLLPITRNTYIALNQVPQGMIEAAKGMGMSGKQILWKIKIPLSIPVIMAGIRNAIVLGVSVATFASLVAAGGLGYFIFAGISRSNLRMVLAGAILVSILGISVNYFLLVVENWITPKGLKIKR
ncbi:MAG TPA: ABC transporter permease [Candidatus Atribacteria bacterium]|nr:ABC transporter permease [Candidatus Atribacteria bacterium]